MKKLLLILLCVPLMFSCGENKKRENKKEEEKNCNIDPDYVMSATNFLNNIEKDNKKYDGKVFQFTMDKDEAGRSYGGGRAEIGFWFSDFDQELNFDFDIWSDDEKEYYNKLTDASKKKGYTGSVLTIKGIYSNENSKLKKDDYIKGEYEFINCCLVIPNK